MSEWISVDERLPSFDEETRVFVCIEQDNSGWCGMPLFDHDRAFKAWWIPQRECFAYSDIDNANHKVTGWMPIPKPLDKTKAP